MRWLLVVLAAGLLESCSTPPAPASGPSSIASVWPPAPNPPRIAFLRNLRGPHDIGQNPSVLGSLARWITGDTGENLNMHKPFAVALDEAGDLCLTDTDDKLVCFADFAHKQWRRYDGVGKIKFVSPVAVARRHGVFYVADSELARVFAFDADGKSVFEISKRSAKPTCSSASWVKSSCFKPCFASTTVMIPSSK